MKDTLFALTIIVPVLVGLAVIGILLFTGMSALHGIGFTLDLGLTR